MNAYSQNRGSVQNLISAGQQAINTSLFPPAGALYVTKNQPITNLAVAPHLYGAPYVHDVATNKTYVLLSSDANGTISTNTITTAGCSSKSQAINPVIKHNKIPKVRKPRKQHQSKNKVMNNFPAGAIKIEILEDINVQTQPGRSVQMGNICTICSLSFSIPSEFQQHMKLHGATSTMSAAATASINTHPHPICPTKPKPTILKQFACKDCDKRFKRKEYLANHAKIHSREKLHNCETCGKSFTQQINLIYHQR